MRPWPSLLCLLMMLSFGCEPEDESKSTYSTDTATTNGGGGGPSTPTQGTTPPTTNGGRNTPMSNTATQSNTPNWDPNPGGNYSNPNGPGNTPTETGDSVPTGVSTQNIETADTGVGNNETGGTIVMGGTGNTTTTGDTAVMGGTGNTTNTGDTADLSPPQTGGTGATSNNGGGNSTSVPAVDQDGDGELNTTDCDDNDPSIFTGAVERCNDVDDDCDSTTIEEGSIVANNANYNTIVDALAANATGEVLVCGGTHTETFTIADPVAVVAVRPATLDLTGLDSVHVNHTDASIDGFTVVGGSSGSLQVTLGTASGITIEGSNNDANGGAVICDRGTLNDLVILDATSQSNGGGVHATSCVLNQIELTGCAAAGLGGGLYLDDTEATGLDISHSAARIGGGLHAQDSFLDDIIIAGCTATEDGGGASLTGELGEFDHFDVSDNHAKDGAGIHIEGGRASGGTVRLNHATDDGAGVHAEDAVVSAIVASDNTSEHQGGGVYALRSVMGGLTVEYNQAQYGAGVFVTHWSGINSLSTLNDSVIENNHGTDGAVLWLDHALIELDSVDVLNNTVDVGSIIHVEATELDWRFSDILSNTAVDSVVSIKRPNADAYLYGLTFQDHAGPLFTVDTVSGTSDWTFSVMTFLNTGPDMIHTSYDGTETEMFFLGPGNFDCHMHTLNPFCS